MKVLLTCPPMINRIKKYQEIINNSNIEIDIPEFTQVMKEDDLVNMIGKYDGWIIGDDPATRKVFESGKKGKLRYAVKWGVGVDNVDFTACKDLNIPISNIPNVFGEEVSDVAVGMLLNLSRRLHLIDLGTKNGDWIKPCGESLTGKKVCILGFGDVGRHLARKLLSFSLDIWVTDPACSKIDGKIKYNYGHGFNEYTPELIKLLDSINDVNVDSFDNCLKNANYIIVTCALNDKTKGIVDREKILKCCKGVKIINVARGPIVNESDVVELLEEGFVESVGFDVFNIEPLPKDSGLRKFNQNIYGSHNGSNTKEAVDRTSKQAIKKLLSFAGM
jgi:D-3-phosphoglycerate dehydrogenase / 2-oxoglutarate reductase